MLPLTPSLPEPTLTFNAPGHADVALSLCTQVPGLAPKRPLEPRHVLTDARIEAFLRQPAVETTQQHLIF
jgi:hypothetical protein